MLLSDGAAVAKANSNCSDRAELLTGPTSNDGEPSVKAFQDGSGRLVASWTSDDTASGTSPIQGSTVLAQRDSNGVWAEEIVSPPLSGDSWIDTSPDGAAYISYIRLQNDDLETFTRRVLPGQPAGPEIKTPFFLDHPAIALDQRDGKMGRILLVGSSDDGRGFLAISNDGGQSWGAPIKFPEPLGYSQTAPVIASNQAAAVIGWAESSYDSTYLIRAAKVDLDTGLIESPATLDVMHFNQFLGFGGLLPVPSISLTRSDNQQHQAFITWPRAEERLTERVQYSSVQVAVSHDQGLNWSAPAQVNDDFGRADHHVYPSVSATADGGAFVAWLDSRNYAPSRWWRDRAQMYLARIRADGQPESNRRLTSCPSFMEGYWELPGSYGDYFVFDASLATPAMVFPNIREPHGLSDVYFLGTKLLGTD